MEIDAKSDVEAGTKLFQVLRVVSFQTGTAVSQPLGIYLDEQGAKDGIQRDQELFRSVGPVLQQVFPMVGIKSVGYAIATAFVKAGDRIEVAASMPKVTLSH